MKISYYVSGHGFGHAIRSYFVSKELSDRETTVYLCTNHPLYLLKPLSQSFSKEHLYSSAKGKVIYRHISNSFDGVVQTDSVTVNVQMTFDRLQSAKQDVLNVSKAETEWLSNNEIQLVCSDACFFILPIAASAQIPSLVVSNFLWDSIYEHYSGGKYPELVNWVVSCYSQSSLWYRMPGFIESPSFHERESLILDVPPAIQKLPSRSRADIITELHSSLKWDIPIDKILSSKLLLVSFGGHPLSSIPWLSEHLVPKNWIVIVAGCKQSPAPGVLSINPELLEIPFGQVTSAIDVVIGKLGYGTCGECIVEGKPMIYVNRAGFIEEKGLLDWMMDERYGRNRIIEMPYAKFIGGEWVDFITEATEFEPYSGLDMNGNSELARQILEFKNFI